MIEALQPILYSYDPEQEGVWVDAAPFRAHLTHLLATGLTEAGHRPADRDQRAVGGTPGSRPSRPTGAPDLWRHRPAVASDHDPGGQGHSLPARAGATESVSAAIDGRRRLDRPPARGPHRSEHQGRGAGSRSASRRPARSWRRSRSRRRTSGGRPTRSSAPTASPRPEPVGAQRLGVAAMTLPTVLILAVATGLALFLATPAVLRSAARAGHRPRRRGTDDSEDPADDQDPLRRPGHPTVRRDRRSAVGGGRRDPCPGAPPPGAARLAGAGHRRTAAGRDRRADDLAAPAVDPGGLGGDGRRHRRRRGLRRLGPAGPRTGRFRRGRCGVRGDLADHPGRDRLR